MAFTPTPQSGMGRVERLTTCSWPTSSLSEPAWSSASSVCSSGTDSDLILKLICVCVHMCAVVCVHVYTFVGSAENFGCPSLSSVYLVFYYLFICSYLSKFYLQLGTFQVGLPDWLMSSREPSVPVSPVLGL